MTIWADIWGPIWGPIWGSSEAQQESVGGRPRRKRWQVQYGGETIEFSTAQAAVSWLSRHNKRVKAQKTQKPASKIEEMPGIIPFSAIQFDGEAVASVMVEGQRAIDRIRTMRDAEIAMVQRRMEEIRRDDEDILKILELFA